MFKAVFNYLGRALAIGASEQSAPKGYLREPDAPAERVELAPEQTHTAFARASPNQEPHVSPQPQVFAESKAPSQRYGLTHAALNFVTPEVRRFSSYLQHENRVSWREFDAACGVVAPKMADLPFGPQTDYLEYHKARFYELDNLAANLIVNLGTPIILDVGMSINTLILQYLFPNARVVVVDRADATLNPIQPFKLFNVDLTNPDLDNVVLPDNFDLILFAEVLEHLLANPVRVLNFLIRHLNPDGFLVITTPNFFSGGNIRAMELRENPQPVFPAHLARGEENQHHVREYSMSELLILSHQAGGSPVALFYSSCWETGPETNPEEHRSNLCVVIKRKADGPLT
jgi:SAM-dependent methyltransferase